MRRQAAFYQVFAVKDGIIWHATQTAKPSGIGRRGGPRPDEDGIHLWHLDDLRTHEPFTPIAKVVSAATIASCLNVKRALREQVEQRLERIQQQLEVVLSRLDGLAGATSQTRSGTD